MLPSPTQAIVALTIVAVSISLWLFVGRDRWHATLEKRFVYGVPWGSALTVAIVVAFYLVVQGGLTNWENPVIHAFVSWSYFYPFGVVTSGIAHGSPAHLVSNVAGTIALAPIAEYAWSHYPRCAGPTDGAAPDEGGTGDEPAATSNDTGVPWDADDELLPDPPSAGDDRSIVERPLVRALVLFPGALLALSVLTSVYSLGPSIGFSGAVYAIVGFAVVYYPLKTVAGVVAASSLGVLWQALANPIVRGTVESGAPAPPSWAGIGFQAHALGFLFGVFAAIALLSKRDRLPSAERVFLGILGVGLVQSLWLVVWPASNDVYVLYRGAGVVALFVVAGLVTIATTDDDATLFTTRKAAIGVLAVTTALIAFPSLFLGIVAVDDGGVAGSDGVEIRDYNVAYADNATSGHTLGVDLGLEDDEVASEITGVVVTSEQREFWAVEVREDVLSHTGNETVTVGGPGWSGTVRAQRIGWSVAGNDTAFVVDLHHDEETTRSFTGEPLEARNRIDGYSVSVVPTEDDFELRVRDDSGVVDVVPIPSVDDSTTVDGLELRTESEDGVRRIFVETEDSRALVAEEETYS